MISDGKLVNYFYFNWSFQVVPPLHYISEWNNVVFTLLYIQMKAVGTLQIKI